MTVQVTTTTLPEVLLLEPALYGDARGFFMESYNQRVFAAAGIPGPFVQDNHSRSGSGVLRGLHYQIRQPQGKLVRVTLGEVFDVAVDLRRGSPHCGQWTGVTLSADNHRQLWIPPGFAHGFYVVTEFAEVQYKTTDYYAPEYERSLRWDDPDIAIAWPVSGDPVLSKKDREAPLLAAAELYP